jgi:drug/metabolite transporter (DMT)-like permease
MALRDWAWIVLLGAIWGASFLFNEYLIRELGPLWVSAGRVGIGAAGCWVFVAVLRRRLPTSPMLYLHFFVLGTITYAVPFALFPTGQAYLTSGVTAIINAMTPITTVIVSHFWPGGERATWLKSLGVLAGFAGVAILAAPEIGAGGATHLWAVGACLLATLGYAVGLNYTRIFARIDPSVIAACALSGATISATAAATFFEGIPTVTRPETFGALAGIGLVSTAFAFQIMYRLLPRVGATSFTTVTFIAPLSAIALGAVMLGETVLPAHVMGMAAIFAGLLLIDGRIVSRWRRART